MVNVLDVLETIKSSSSTLKKVAEAQKAQIETTASRGETTKHQAKIKTGPSESRVCQRKILGNRRRK
jgi:ribosomal protein S28E/S33